MHEKNREQQRSTIKSLLGRLMACTKELIRLGWILWKRPCEIRSCIEILSNDIKIYTNDMLPAVTTSFANTLNVKKSTKLWSSIIPKIKINKTTNTATLRADVKTANDGRLKPIWHRMLYSCTQQATVGVKGLKSSTVLMWHKNFMN